MTKKGKALRCDACGHEAPASTFPVACEAWYCPRCGSDESALEEVAMPKRLSDRDFAENLAALLAQFNRYDEEGREIDDDVVIPDRLCGSVAGVEWDGANGLRLNLARGNRLTILVKEEKR